MKDLVSAIGALALATSAAHPVAQSAITSHAASVAQGAPLDGSDNAAIDRAAPQLRQASAHDRRT